MLLISHNKDDDFDVVSTSSRYSSSPSSDRCSSKAPSATTRVSSCSSAISDVSQSAHSNSSLNHHHNNNKVSVLNTKKGLSIYLNYNQAVIDSHLKGISSADLQTSFEIRKVLLIGACRKMKDLIMHFTRPLSNDASECLYQHIEFAASEAKKLALQAQSLYIGGMHSTRTDSNSSLNSVECVRQAETLQEIVSELYVSLYWIMSQKEFNTLQLQNNRDKRQAEKDRHALERSRLANRKEGFQRHTPSTNPLEILETAVGYIPDAKRLHGDSAGEERAMRDLEIARRQQITEKKRKDHTEREQSIHQQRELEYEKEKQKQEARLGSEKKNKGLASYNIITKQPLDPEQRKLQTYQDQVREYRGAVRADILYQRGSSTGCNPITGEPLPQRVVIPPKPSLPNQNNKFY
ncbi:hypothetical protein C9374_004681 [Naegleria lovaniensis]|uniref:Uncharacterized protein n=1 Tax=Naegleria lovaniensis TaxID=51637 RepID=A0AA88KIY0_NAELO|nr:uncharacterized protein C9374_004681 [Naegleria lovaniensis]KAG2383344.1 hypothetical protein C9374_004681 [Naegleria lovaniensis]